MRIHTMLAAATVGASLLCAPANAQQSTAFTYQGRLTDAGDPANGDYDITFRLYDADAGGNLIAGPVALSDVPVTDGLLTAEVDFGINAFNEDRWLDIEVEGTPLSPRRQVTGAPIANQLRGVAVANNGYFGIGVATPGARLEVREDDAEAILGVSTFQNGVFGASAAPARAGVAGSTTSATGYGVHGSVSLVNGSGRGVYGTSQGETGAGVYGLAQHETGQNHGVYGETVSTADGATGIYGYASGLSGTTRGAYFANESNGNGASAVIAQALATNGNTFGVQASVASPDGRAISGFVNAPSGGTAVRGSNNNQDGWAGYFLGRVFLRDHTTVGKNNVQITSAEAFGVHTTAESNQFGGMYVSGQNGGSLPFYGYSAGGTTNDVDAYHYFHGNLDQWRLWCGDVRMVVNRQNGATGIGTTSPGFLLHVNGSAGKPGGGSWSVASDGRLKKDVHRHEDALDMLLSLRGVSFEYQDPEAINELPGRRIGMVAQEVEQVFPDWIDEGSDGYKRMTVRGFEALAVESLRDLREEKDAQIEALQRESEALRDRLETLEGAVETLLATTEGE